MSREEALWRLLQKSTFAKPRSTPSDFGQARNPILPAVRAQVWDSPENSVPVAFPMWTPGLDSLTGATAHHGLYPSMRKGRATRGNWWPPIPSRYACRLALGTTSPASRSPRPFRPPYPAFC